MFALILQFQPIKPINKGFYKFSNFIYTILNSFHLVKLRHLYSLKNNYLNLNEDYIYTFLLKPLGSLILPLYQLKFFIVFQICKNLFIDGKNYYFA